MWGSGVEDWQDFLLEACLETGVQATDRHVYNFETECASTWHAILPVSGMPLAGM